MSTIAIENVEEAKPLERSHHPLQPFAAATLVMLATFANFLSYNAYPFARTEVAIMAAGLIALSACFALLHRISGNFGKALLDALLVIIAIDINTDFTLPGIIIGGIVALLRMSNVSLLTPLAMISGAVLVSSSLGLSQVRRSIETTAGEAALAKRDDSVLHLLLDEHGGSGGAAPALRQDLIDFYVGRGFRLFDRGYSRHFHTVNAIPDALNFGEPGTSRNVDKSLDVGQTRLLTLYRSRGFRLNIYQSEFADYCRYQRVSQCTRYWGPSLSFVADSDIAAVEKAQLMAFKLASLSVLLRDGPRWANFVAGRLGLRPYVDLNPNVKDGARSSAVAGLAILDKMTLDLSAAQPGNVYFAHVLAPHYPYVVDEACRDLPYAKWELRRSSRPVSERKAAYAAQTRCVMKKLDAMISAYLASPAGKNATIVIHGDHGDRVSAIEPAEWNRGKIGPDDFMAGYSTLLAVRSPGVEAGLDTVPVAVPDLLRTIARNDFKSLAGLQPGSEDIYLDGPNWSVGKAASIKGSWPERN